MGHRQLGSLAGALAIALLTAGCAETDTGITTAVKSRFAADDVVSTYRIDVETDDSVVTLSGEVDSPAARDRALELARNTDGVREVVDRLTVAPGATPTSGKKIPGAGDAAGERETGTAADEAAREAGDATRQVGDVTANAVLTSKVKTKLLADTAIAGLEIDVDSRAGVVTLTGTVSSAAQKDRALRLARETEGVTSVVDRLKVGQ